MVVLPLGFVTTRYPGYYWDTDWKVLYSIKVDGSLYRMKLLQPSHFNKWSGPGYRVSHKGIRRTMLLEYLTKLQVEDTVIGFSEKNE